MHKKEQNIGAMLEESAHSATTPLRHRKRFAIWSLRVGGITGLALGARDAVSNITSSSILDLNSNNEWADVVNPWDHDLKSLAVLYGTLSCFYGSLMVRRYYDNRIKEVNINDHNKKLSELFPMEIEGMNLDQLPVKTVGYRTRQIIFRAGQGKDKTLGIARTLFDNSQLKK